MQTAKAERTAALEREKQKLQSEKAELTDRLSHLGLFKVAEKGSARARIAAVDSLLVKNQEEACSADLEFRKESDALEAQHALRLYQLARLDPRAYRDAAILFAFFKGYSLSETTELLFELGEEEL